MKLLCYIKGSLFFQIKLLTWEEPMQIVLKNSRCMIKDKCKCSLGRLQFAQVFLSTQHSLFSSNITYPFNGKRLVRVCGGGGRDCQVQHWKRERTICLKTLKSNLLLTSVSFQMKLTPGGKVCPLVEELEVYAKEF